MPTTFDELIAAAKTFKSAGVTPVLRHARRRLDRAVAVGAAVRPAPAAATSSRSASRARPRSLKAGTAPPRSSASCSSTPSPTRCRRVTRTGPRHSPAGKSAMLLLGSYAVPQIRLGKPKFTVGSMALPATDDPAKTTLVSGVDVVLTASRNGAHPQEVNEVHRVPHATDGDERLLQGAGRHPDAERADQRRPRPRRGAALHRLGTDRRLHRPPVHPRDPAGAAAPEIRAGPRRDADSSMDSTTTGTRSPNAAPGGSER